jgi:putative DNA primase/helicase
MEFEKTIFLKGGGGNGKGTFIAILQELFGENTSNVSMQDLSDNRFAAASLYGKMVNLQADLPMSYIQESSMFKLLTSGDMLEAEFKGKDRFRFRNRAKMIFSMNEIPAAKDNSEGFFRRLLIIPFENKFDNNLLRAKLFSPQELSGLLLKGLEGLKRLRENQKFSIENCEVENYRSENDSAYNFLKSHCRGNKGKFSGCQEIYNDYGLFCDELGLKVYSQGHFNKKLKALFPQVILDKNKQGRRWKNIEVFEKVPTAFESGLHLVET